MALWNGQIVPGGAEASPNPAVAEDEQFLYFSDGTRAAKELLSPDYLDAARQQMSLPAGTEVGLVEAGGNPLVVGPGGDLVQVPARAHAAMKADQPQVNGRQGTWGAPVKDWGAPGTVQGDPTAPPPVPAQAGGPLGAVNQMAMGASPEVAQAPLKEARPPSAGGSMSRAQKELEQGLEAQKQAIQATAKAKADGILAVAKEQERVVGELELMEAASRDKEAQRKQAIDGQMQKFEAALADLKAPLPSIDPNRFWAEKSTTQKIIGAIGLALGTFGSALTNTPNHSLAIIQGAIADDIDAQKANISLMAQQRRENVSGQQTLLEVMRGKFDDERAADAATRAAALDLVKQRLLTTAAKSEAAEVQAKAVELAAMLDQEKAKSHVAFANAIFDRQVKAEQLAQEWARIGVAAQGKEKEGAPGTPETFVPNYGFALDKEAAKTARKLSGDYRSVKAALTRLKDWRKDNAGTLDPEQIRKGRAMAVQVQLKLKKSEELGTLDKGSQDTLDKLIGGKPDEFGYYLGQVETVEAGVDDSFDSQMSQWMDPRTYKGPSRSDLEQKYGAKPK